MKLTQQALVEPALSCERGIKYRANKLFGTHGQTSLRTDGRTDNSET